MTTNANAARGTTERDRAVLERVRGTVTQILESNDRYRTADPQLKKSIAKQMLDLSMLAADLAAQDRPAAAKPAPTPTATALTARSAAPPTAGAAPHAPTPAPPREPTADGGASTVAALRDAIDFPTFVTSLIQGIFESITGSNIHQIERLADLLDNVSAASTTEFGDANIDDAAATQWALARFPFLTTSGEGELHVREGVELSQHAAAMGAALGVPAAQLSSLDESSLNESLLPLVRAKLARSRLSTLSTLVQLGLQRIVVDEGRLHASMDLRVDTRSLTERDQASRSDWRVNAGASGHYGMGLWGVSASVSTSIGKVESDHRYSQQELSSRAGLRSSVDIAFRTEQVPLDRMATPDQRVRIDANSRVPAGTGNESLLSSGGPRATTISIDNVPAPPPAPDSHAITETASTNPAPAAAPATERTAAAPTEGAR